MDVSNDVQQKVNHKLAVGIFNLHDKAKRKSVIMY